jgi:APA family basic amino acid/polyamine antiporter
MTGVGLLLLIAFVPVVGLAKLASAFQTPAYPYVQVFGFLGGAALLTQMGALPIVGAVGIIAGGLVVYLLYGRPRTDRTGAISTILGRRRENRESVQRAETD